MDTEVAGTLLSSSPYKSIGVIIASFPDGVMLQGTASLVGVNDILTATHVVYAPDHGGWATGFDFYFGADYNNQSNVFETTGSPYTPQDWTIDAWPQQAFVDASNTTMMPSETAYDMAIIGIDTDLGNTLGSLNLNPGYDAGISALAVGYPADGTGMMQENISVFYSSANHIYQSYVDVMGPGSSGGPLMAGGEVIGVKSTGYWWADVGFLYDQLRTVMLNNDTLLGLPPDTQAPQLVRLSPADDASNVSYSSNLVFSFDELVQPGAGAVSLLTADGQLIENFDVTNSPRVEFSGQTLTVDPSLLFDADTTYRVTIDPGSVTDLAGNAWSGLTSYQFTTRAAAPVQPVPDSPDPVVVTPPDPDAPLIVDFSPANGASGVEVDQNLVLTFDEPIQAGRSEVLLLKNYYDLVEVFDFGVGSRLLIDGNELTIDPTANLEEGISYRLLLQGGCVTDLNGNSFGGEYNYGFTAYKFIDEQAPDIVDFSPASGAEAVMTDTELVVTFSEPVVRGAGTIQLVTAEGRVAQALNLSDETHVIIDGAQLTIVPVDALDYATSYQLTIPSGAVKDLYGNAFAGDNSLNFSTKAAPDLAAPRLADSTPTFGQSGFGVSDDLLLAFDESILPGSGEFVLTDSEGQQQHFALDQEENVSFQDNRIFIDPPFDLDYASSYRLEVAAGVIIDLAGNPNDALIINFTTEEAPGLLLSGTLADDFLQGGPGPDSLQGKGGDDRLQGGGGDDLLDGGEGIDVALYAETSEVVQRAIGLGSMTVTSPGEGVDLLTGVERLVFSDQALAFDLDADAGFVAELINVTFGAPVLEDRTIIGIGLALLSEGMERADMADLALSLCGASTDTDVVATLWTHLFGAAPSVEQMAPFVDMLSSGEMSRSAMTIIAAQCEVNRDNMNLPDLRLAGLPYLEYTMETAS